MKRLTHFGLALLTAGSLFGAPTTPSLDTIVEKTAIVARPPTTSHDEAYASQLATGTTRRRAVMPPAPYIPPTPTTMVAMVPNIDSKSLALSNLDLTRPAKYKVCLDHEENNCRVDTLSSGATELVTIPGWSQITTTSRANTVIYVFGDEKLQASTESANSVPIATATGVTNIPFPPNPKTTTGMFWEFNPQYLTDHTWSFFRSDGTNTVNLTPQKPEGLYSITDNYFSIPLFPSQFLQTKTAGVFGTLNDVTSTASGRTARLEGAYRALQQSHHMVLGVNASTGIIFSGHSGGSCSTTYLPVNTDNASASPSGASGALDADGGNYVTGLAPDAGSLDVVCSNPTDVWGITDDHANVVQGPNDAIDSTTRLSFPVYSPSARAYAQNMTSTPLTARFVGYNLQGVVTGSATATIPPQGNYSFPVNTLGANRLEMLVDGPGTMVGGVEDQYTTTTTNGTVIDTKAVRGQRAPR